MVAAPLGLLLSLVGLIFDKNKGPALAGLIIGGILALLLVMTTLC